MTYIEAKDILDKRINFRDTEGYLTVDNKTSDSGRYFQDEHSAITLLNIRSCQPETNITDVKFNEFLTNMRYSVILNVLSDVYGSESKISARDLNCNIGIFDNAISLRMVVVLAELIITSTRSNRIERLSKEFVQQLHFDINGNYGQNLNPNFPRVEGFGKKYQDAIKLIKRSLSKVEKFKSITAGAYSNYLNPTIGNEPFENR